MVEIPISVLSLIVGVSLVLPLFAYHMKTRIYSSAVFFICGAFLFIIALAMDSITLGQLQNTTNYNNSTDTIIFGYTPDNYALKNPTTGEPTITAFAIIFFGLMLILIGVLIEKFA